MPKKNKLIVGSSILTVLVLGVLTFMLYDPVSLYYALEKQNYQKVGDILSNSNISDEMVLQIITRDGVTIDSKMAQTIFHNCIDKKRYKTLNYINSKEYLSSSNNINNKNISQEKNKSNETNILGGLSDEQKHNIAVRMINFNYYETLRNIYNIGSTQNTWVLVYGYIDSIERTGIVNDKPSYTGVISSGNSSLRDKYYVFTYTGNFNYIKGDSIAAYGIIVSDGTVNHYNNKGELVNKSQAIKIAIKDHDKGFIEDYSMNDFEKEYYLNKTYISDKGKTIYFSLKKIDERPIYDVSMRKYGDGTIQMTYSYSDQRVGSIFLYPNGRLTPGNGSPYYSDDIDYYPSQDDQKAANFDDNNETETSDIITHLPTDAECDQFQKHALNLLESKGVPVSFLKGVPVVYKEHLYVDIDDPNCIQPTPYSYVKPTYDFSADLLRPRSITVYIGKNVKNFEAELIRAYGAALIFGYSFQNNFSTKDKLQFCIFFNEVYGYPEDFVNVEYSPDNSMFDSYGGKQKYFENIFNNYPINMYEPSGV